MRFRIRDLLAGRTLVESDRGRDLVAYHRENHRPGRDDWLWQYDDGVGWREIPRPVLNAWWARSQG